MSDARAAGKTVLLDALDVGKGEVVSLVGGGGKTSIMFGAARELVGLGIPVITTTTTKIMEPRREQTPHLHLCGERGITGDFWEDLDIHRHVTLASGRLPEGKLKGIEPDVVTTLKSHQKLKPIIIVEADGSAQRPLKAPNDTEPVVPLETTMLVAVMGIEALGAALGTEHVFRPEIYSRLTGLAVGEVITAESIAASLAHSRGLLRDKPAGSRVVTFINKVENEDQFGRAQYLARLLLLSGISGLCRVITGRVKHPPAILDIACPR